MRCRPNRKPTVTSAQIAPMIHGWKRSATVQPRHLVGVGDAHQRVALARHRERDAGLIDEGDVAAVEPKLLRRGQRAVGGERLEPKAGLGAGADDLRHGAAGEAAEVEQRLVVAVGDHDAAADRTARAASRRTAAASLTAMKGAAGAGASPLSVNLTAIGADVRRQRGERVGDAAPSPAPGARSRARAARPRRRSPTMPTDRRSRAACRSASVSTTALEPSTWAG